mmetsp:Transcript_44868/g.94127  ORF Transcript_44868/g.94127 Transcript_44868/m.94127 type:complete len:437 (+) Transcript_44868:156-1466(+)
MGTDESAMILPRDHWISHGQAYATAMTVLQESLVNGIMKLERQNQLTLVNGIMKRERQNQPTNIAIVGCALLPEGLTMHDDSLLPLWKRFCDALSFASCDEKSCINLSISFVQLPNEVMKFLEPALEVTHVESLRLRNNRLGTNGIKSMKRLLIANTSLCSLVLIENEIECEEDAVSLLDAARKHASLGHVELDSCDIGFELSFTPGIVPDLLNLHLVSLVNNEIGLYGASIISNCLATNPTVSILNLDGNGFNDDDATLFAKSLKTNTKLLSLKLRGNNFTYAGIRTLYRAVYDDRSLNAIHHSNHTCELVLFTYSETVPNDIDEAVMAINSNVFDAIAFDHSSLESDGRYIANMMRFAECRKKAKVLNYLRSDHLGYHKNTQHLNNVPLELMPEVLAFLQDGGRYSGTEDKSLDLMFQSLQSRPQFASTKSIAN